MFLRCANGRVCDLLLGLHQHWNHMNSCKAHFSRSKQVTLLPTGESKHVPSGVKQRFPFRYTVPRRLENYSNVSFAGYVEGVKMDSTL